MAIPAYTKVREASIIRTVQSGNGNTLTESQRAIYREAVKAGHVSAQPAPEVQTAAPYPPADQPTQTLPLQTVTVGAKRYVLVPKVEAQETTIDGRAFWLVPVVP